jgi:hypothetical protein
MQNGLPSRPASPARIASSLRRYPMRAVIPCVLVLWLGTVSPAAARHGEPPVSQARGVAPIATVPVIHLPAIDADKLLRQDAARTKPGPLRVAVPVDVDVTPRKDGSWERLKDGGRLWRVRFRSPGATDLNFGFTRFRLPQGAKLYVVSEAEGREGLYEGPYTAADNKPHGQLWTPMVPGDKALIELFLPPGGTLDQVELELTRAAAGYRDLLGDKGAPRLHKQGSCNIDVVCPEGDPWRDEIRSVARLLIGGTGLCTGTLMRDRPGSFRNFVLTAAHCDIVPAVAPSVVAYWNFDSPACGFLSGGSLAQSQTGSTFRARRADVDMSLVELDNPPDAAFDVYYSGWDRSGAAPNGSVGIHHPDGDEKAISFNTDPLITVDNCIGTGGRNSHWDMNWEQGTTEPGSSGSGIWDPSTHGLVGFLSGGFASCSNPSGLDCYGKLSVAWDGPDPSSRLRDWLDPDNTGAVSVAGSNPQGQIHYSAHAGSDFCAAGGASDGNLLWEPGEAIELNVSLTANDRFTGIVGTLSSPTPGVTITRGIASWPDLTSGAVSENSTPLGFTLDRDTVPCLADIRLELSVTANEGGPFLVAFADRVGQDLEPDIPKAIPDNNPVGAVSGLFVAQDTILNDVNVRVRIDHSWVGDLVIALRSPAGTEVVLLDRPGVPSLGSVGCGDNDMDITFDDSSGLDPETHCAGSSPWLSGDAAPLEPLAAFDGESALGLWELRVSDHAGLDVGNIVDWELVTTPSLTGSCTVCSAIPPAVAWLPAAPARAHGDWTAIAAPSGFGDPVVIAGPPSFNGQDPGVVRLRNITDTGFDLRFQEWDYRSRDHGDQVHAQEDVPYVVLASGRHNLSDGSVWEVGSFDLEGTGSWEHITFRQPFSEPPHVLLTVQTFRGQETVTVRAKQVTVQGFDAALFEEEALMNGHAVETVGYLAVKSAAKGGVVELDGDPVAYSLQTLQADQRWVPVLSERLKLEEEQSWDEETWHVDEILHVLSLGGRIFAQQVTGNGFDTTAIRRLPPAGGTPMEWGIVRGITHDWRVLPFAKTYLDPVVVAKPASSNGADPGVIRLEDVAADSARIRYQEWNYLDGRHWLAEDVFYVVGEAGVHTAGNLGVQAGRLASDRLVSEGRWEPVDFPSPFAAAPVVLASVLTGNGADAVTTRIRGLRFDGFELAMEEQESKRDGHIAETLGWVAVQTGSTAIDGRTLEAFFDTADHRPTTIPYSRATDHRFLTVVADIDTGDGLDPAALRYADPTSTGITLWLEEETSGDAEVEHLLEKLGVLAGE